MDFVSVPAEVGYPHEANLTNLVERKASESKNPVVYKVQKSPGNWVPVRATEFRDQVYALAKGLIAQGIEPGDKVGIMSRTRYEWAVIDFAIWHAGAVTVPVYETSSPSQAAWALSHSDAKAVFVENQKLFDVVKKAEEVELDGVDMDVLSHRWVIDAGVIETLVEAGSELPDSVVEERRASLNMDSIATIVYTSGTTGCPKGCPISHGNFMNLSANTKITIPEIANETNSTIIFLPLAHVLARLIQVLAFDCGVVVGHSPNIKNLSSDLDSFKPTMLLVVPRVFEKIYEGAMEKAKKGGKVNFALFKRSLDVADKWSKAKIKGDVPRKLQLQYEFYNRLVYSKLNAAMGGKLKFAVSGGGRLHPKYGHFYHAVGVQVVEGYGMTETTAPLAVGRIRHFDIGNVGTLIPGTSAKLDEDGELLIKGVGVIKEYYKNPEETEVAFTEDGWIRTGDIAEIDDDGKIKITGRKKEIIVTAGGKNVIPVPTEDQIRTSPLVSQAMLIGDEKPFIAALITLDPDVLPDQLEHLGLPRTLTMKEASTNPTVREAIQKIIDEANAFVSRAESIREFRIMDRDLTEEEGHLTPSLKLRRAQILKDFPSYVEDIYNRTAKAAAAQTEKFQEFQAGTKQKLEEMKVERAEKTEAKRVERAEKLEELKASASEKMQMFKQSRAPKHMAPEDDVAAVSEEKLADEAQEK